MTNSPVPARQGFCLRCALLMAVALGTGVLLLCAIHFGWLGAHAPAAGRVAEKAGPQ